MKKRLSYRAIMFVLPLVTIMVFLYMKSSDPDLYAYIVSEDSFFEYLQALAYLSTGAVFSYLALKEFRSGFIILCLTLLIAGVIFIFIAMEEISWGQRILGIKTPGWFQQNNIQNEITIHNLKPVQKIIHTMYAFLGAIFSFGWIPMKLYCITRYLSSEITSVLILLKPRLYLMTYFLPLFLFYIWLIIKGNPGPFLTFNDQEISELLLSIGTLLYSIDIHKHLNLIQDDADIFS